MCQSLRSNQLTLNPLLFNTVDSSPVTIPEVTTSPFTNDTNTPTRYTLHFKHNGKPPNRYFLDEEEHSTKYPIANYVSTKKLPEPLKPFSHSLSLCHVLIRIHEAQVDPKWTQAIYEEIEALLENKTWTLVSFLEGKKIVGYKWLLCIKHKGDGSI